MENLLLRFRTNKIETREKFLTFPVVILILLMLSFLAATMYILVSTFF
jgi:hypothetical protein